MTTREMQTGLWSIFVVFGIGGFAVVLILLCQPSDQKTYGSFGKPNAVNHQPAPPSKDHENWNHRELILFLNSKGITFETMSARTGSAHGPAMYFYPFGEKNSCLAIDAGAPPSSRLWKGIAYVQIRSSPQEAKGQAGTVGEDGFSWGRFLFHGDPDFIQKIRVALEHL